MRRFRVYRILGGGVAGLFLGAALGARTASEGSQNQLTGAVVGAVVCPIIYICYALYNNSAVKARDFREKEEQEIAKKEAMRSAALQARKEFEESRDRDKNSW